MRNKLLAGVAVAILALGGCSGGGGGGTQTVTRPAPAPAAEPAPAPRTNASPGWTSPANLLGWEYKITVYEHIGGRRVEAKYNGDGYIANPPANLTFNGNWHGVHTSRSTRTGNVWLRTEAWRPDSTCCADQVEFNARFTGGGVDERFDNVWVSDDGEFIEGPFSGESASHLDGEFVRDGSTWKVGGEFRADGVFGAFGASN